MSAFAVTKMCGSGNDFIVVGPRDVARLEPDPSDWIRRVCCRRLSVGADGVLFVEPLSPGRVQVRFFNPDGTGAFCGNGSRCAARFAVHREMTGPNLTLETIVGQIPAEVSGGSVRLVLPAPVDCGERRLTVGAETIEGRWITAGVPHFVIEVQAVESAPLERWGPALRRHPEFGEAGANIDVVAARPAGGLDIRTWERGVEGETLACGSGAVAGAMAQRLGGANGSIELFPASRIPLRVELPGPATQPSGAVLIGDARIVFEGRIGPEAVAGWPRSLDR